MNFEQQIKIFDNFFDTADLDQINSFMERPKWSFNGGSLQRRFWHMDGLENELFFSDYLFHRISAFINRKFKILRIYANGQTAGQSGTPHYDDGDWTFLFYPTAGWDYSWNGSLFFIKDDEIFKTVAYKTNRALFFPAKILHYADAPFIGFEGIRISIAWKLQEI